MAGFNLDDYQPVEERNAQFWAKYPQGRILTELVFDDGQRFTFRCEVYTDREDPRPAATGYATETVSTSGVNKTSALENAETSAEGRALARLGFAPKGARPSREEMSKAHRGQANGQANGQAQRSGPKQWRPADPAEARAWLGKTCKENGWDLAVVAARFEAQHGIPLGRCTDTELIVQFRSELFGVPSHELVAAPTEAGAAR